MWKYLGLLGVIISVSSVLANDADQTCENPESCFPAAPDDAKYASDCYFPSNYFLKVPVQAIREETHNSKIITFGLPEDRSLSHNVSSAILMGVPKEGEGKQLMRAYNPITASDKKGSFDLLIKLYPDGVASTYVSKLKVGDMVEFKQSKGNIKKFQLPFEGVEKITMLAGGTGITPMIQALGPVLEKGTQEVRLLYSNKTPDDIMLKAELDALAEKYADRFTLQYVVGEDESDTRHEASGYETGWIDEAKIKRLGHAPASDVVVWVCGVDAMYTSLAGSRLKPLKEGSILHTLGYTNENVWRS